MIDLVYENAWYMIDTIAIDAVTSEQHSLSGNVTTHPVEDGADMSDHFRDAPPSVHIEGVISDTPVRLPGSHTGGSKPVQKTFDIENELFGMKLGPIPLSIPAPTTQGSVTTFEPALDRVTATWAVFIDIYKKRRLVTIVTSLDIYDDMALQNLQVNKRGKSYQFSCDAVQVTRAESASTTALVVPRDDRAKPSVRKGKQPPKEEAELELPLTSDLKQLYAKWRGPG